MNIYQRLGLFVLVVYFIFKRLYNIPDLWAGIISLVGALLIVFGLYLEFKERKD